MSLFRNQTHGDIWVEHNCPGCYLDSNCPIRERALRTARKPVEWERNPRKGVLMADTYKCSAKSARPPVHKREDLTPPMFDVQPVADMGDHA